MHRLIIKYEIRYGIGLYLYIYIYIYSYERSQYVQI